MISIALAVILIFSSSWGSVKTANPGIRLVKLNVEIWELPFLTQLLGEENHHIDHLGGRTFVLSSKLDQLLRQNNVEYETINHEEDEDEDSIEKLLTKGSKREKRRKRHASPEEETEDDIKSFCKTYIEDKQTFGPEMYKDEEMVYNTTYGYLNIMKWMKTMEAKHSKTVEILKYGDTYEQKCLVYAKINEKKGQKVVVVDAGIHAREWASISSVSVFMHKLVHELERGNSPFSNYTFFIIPVFNPDGYTYSRKEPDLQHRLWRKNRAVTSNPDCIGVDLNRNYCVAWNECSEKARKKRSANKASENSCKTTTSNPTTTKKDCREKEANSTTKSNTNQQEPPQCSATYKGESCMDQAENIAFSKLRKDAKSNITAYFNVHTVMNAWLYPYAYTNVTVPPNSKKERAAVVKAVEKIKEEYGIEMKYGTPYSVLSYGACGSLMDWMSQQLGVPYSYALELTPLIRDLNYIFRINDTDVRTYGNLLTTGIKTVIEEINRDN